MNYPKSNIIALAAALIFTTVTNAQIVGKSTDTNYYNTTIIYKKGDIKDNDILSKVESDYGMGDIIRIADAPPKHTEAPVTKAPQKLTVVETSAKPANIKPLANATKVTVNNSQPAPPVGKALSKEEIKPVKQVEAAPVTVVKRTESVTKTKVTSKTAGAKSAKAIRKKKSRSSKITFARPAKRQKHGKQRYGCPKF